MGSLEKAIKKLAEFRKNEKFKNFFEEEGDFDNENFDNTILDSNENNEELWEDEFDIKETPVPYDKNPFDENPKEPSYEEDEDLNSLIDASDNTKKLLKIATKLNKLGEWDSKDLYFQGLDKAVTPDQIEGWDDDDIPDEYKMQQLSNEDVDSILGMESDDFFVEEPKSGKKHYDIQPDISLYDEDFEEKVTEAPTEVEDFIQQLQEELDKNNPK